MYTHHYTYTSLYIHITIHTSITYYHSVFFLYRYFYTLRSIVDPPENLRILYLVKLGGGEDPFLIRDFVYKP